MLLWSACEQPSDPRPPGSSVTRQASRRARQLATRPHYNAIRGAPRRLNPAKTDATVRSLSLARPCRIGEGTNLRWVLLHLINETARHFGHADATRELLDGMSGE